MDNWITSSRTNSRYCPRVFFTKTVLTGLRLRQNAGSWGSFAGGAEPRGRGRREAKWSLGMEF